MILAIHVPDSDVHDYLDVVKHQLDQGFTSGHVDRETHWSIDDGPDSLKELVDSYDRAVHVLSVAMETPDAYGVFDLDDAKATAAIELADHVSARVKEA